MTTRPTKSSIRKQARLIRSGLSDTERIAAAEQITVRLLDLVDRLDARTVHVYWPIDKQREVDTRSFIRQLLDRGIVVALPVVSEKVDGEMSQRQLISELDFKLGRFGTHEPGSGPVIPPSQLDLVVAPALASDRRGFRIGYGGGFYDRFLVKTRCPRACVVYSTCLVDAVPADDHDIRMDFIITETETIVASMPAT